MRRFTKSYFIGDNNIRAKRRYLSEDVQLHFHEYYEIEYILSGKGFYTLNGTVYPVEEGLLSFLTPLDYHSHHAEDVEMINISFDGSLATQRYLKPFIQLTTSKVIMINEQQKTFLLPLLNEIIEYQHDPEYSTSLIDCVLLKFTQIFPLSPFLSTNQSIAKMHYYMLENFQKDISLESTAAYVGLSPNYASALFKKELNVNFKTYLNMLRYNHAKKLLLSTNETIASICISSGFEDVPNFVKRFKKQFGVTPSQFRKNPR